MYDKVILGVGFALVSLILVVILDYGRTILPRTVIVVYHIVALGLVMAAALLFALAL